MKFVEPQSNTPAVVIVTFNSASNIEQLLHDLSASSLDSASVLCVDNGSRDATRDLVTAFEEKSTLLHRPDNPGYAAAINTALDRLIEPGPIFVLNPDTRLGAHALEALMVALEAPGVGLSVPRIEDEREELYPSLRHEPSVWRALADAILGQGLRRRFDLGEMMLHERYYEDARDVDWATGAAMCFRGDLTSRIGQWDERFFLYSEETDWAHRVRAHGLRVRYCPDAVVGHQGGASGASTLLEALMVINKVRYAKTTHGAGSALGIWFANIIGCLLRLQRPGVHEIVRILARPRTWNTLPDRIRGTV